MGKAANTNAATIRTPGEDAPKPEDTASDGGVSDGAGAPAGPALTTSDVLQGAADAKVPGAPVTMEDRFAAMEAEMQRLAKENEHLLATQGALVDIARAGRAAVEPSVKLPRASEFPVERQAEMKTAVLTQEGWVVPAHLGSSPVLHELQKLGLSATA